jgi:hypothetical protein
MLEFAEELARTGLSARSVRMHQSSRRNAIDQRICRPSARRQTAA